MKKVLPFPSPVDQPIAQAVTRALSDTCVFAPGKVYIVKAHESLGIVLEYTLDMEREGSKMDLDLHPIGTGTGYRWPSPEQLTHEQTDAILDLLARVVNEWPYDDIPVKLVRALNRYENQLKLGQIDRALGTLKTEV